MSQFPTFVVRHDLDGPLTPSIPFAREFDAACPGGKAHFIVFYRQSSESQPACWIMERTEDKATMASGDLDDMLALVGTEAYPYSRRATWAEDTLRLKSSIFDMDYKYGEALDSL
jgi:hypothetical protein